MQRRRPCSDDEASHSDVKQKLIMALRNRVIDEYAPVRTRRGYRYVDAERLTSLSSELVRQILEELAESGELSRRLVRSLASCPSCGSTELQLVIACNRCGSQRVKKGIIYQCVSCHNYLLKEDILGEGRLRCPKCGADRPRYLIMGKFYACLNCNSIPVEPSWRAMCRSCGSIFNQDETDTLELYSYSLDGRDRSEAISEWALTTAAEEISKLGYSLRINEEVKGLSGVMHRFSGVVRDSSSDAAKLVLDIVSSDSGLDEQHVLSFILKVKDVKAENSLLVVNSRISAEARRIVESQKINLLVVKNLPTLPYRLKLLIGSILSKKPLRQKGLNSSAKIP
jgi:DNA-directed RNA polymerase subunit RPC12/RpoP